MMNEQTEVKQMDTNEFRKQLMSALIEVAKNNDLIVDHGLNIEIDATFEAQWITYGVGIRFNSVWRGGQ